MIALTSPKIAWRQNESKVHFSQESTLFRETLVQSALNKVIYSELLMNHLRKLTSPYTLK